MKLADLNPRWVGTGGEGVTRNGKPVPHRHGVGISFDCPCGCEDRVYVDFVNPISGGAPVQGAYGWQRTGDTFEGLTLAPSILRRDKCRWHGFITDGAVRTV